MPKTNCADVLFCIDVSISMNSCIKGVCEYLNDFVRGLTQNGQQQWDVRVDFLAFSDDKNNHYYRTTNLTSSQVIDKLYRNPDPSSFFTKDLKKFQKSLSKKETYWAQQQLHALDVASDFPWRTSTECHRVLVLLTDDVPGEGYDESRINAQIAKVMEKRIKLFMIAPPDRAYYCLSQANHSEYNDSVPLQDLTPTSIDFSALLEAIGKSVSVARCQSGGSNTPTPLYGQKSWRPSFDRGVEIVTE